MYEESSSFFVLMFWLNIISPMIQFAAAAIAMEREFGKTIFRQIANDEAKNR